MKGLSPGASLGIRTPKQVSILREIGKGGGARRNEDGICGLCPYLG